MNHDVLAAGNRVLFGLDGALLAGAISATPASRAVVMARSCGQWT
jgi:hypothetical protein